MKKWSRLFWLGLTCTCVVGFTSGCGSENQIMEENDGTGIDDDIMFEDTIEPDMAGFEEFTEYDNLWKEDTEVSENSIYDTYEAFLAGNLSVYNELTGEENTIDVLLEAENGTYLYCDINGDSVDELHVKSDTHYFVLQTDNGELNVIYDGAVYEYPVNEVGISGVLYYKEGDAPKHETYQFRIFDIFGDNTESVNFEWYDDNEDLEMDEGDCYLYNDSEISMEDWLKKTEVYRDLDVENVSWETWQVSGN